MIQQYLQQRNTPGILYCVYTNYQSDFKGDYTYFIGEEKESLQFIPENFSSLTIPSQHYQKFTVGPGKMPSLCIDAWQKIWSMNEADLEGQRNYLADFEIYDARASDPMHTILDIYIGIQK